MAKRTITKDVYDAMVVAFRSAPGNLYHCAKTCSVDRVTSRRAWYKGWPERGWPPIVELLAEEMTTARALRFEAEMQAEFSRAKEEASQILAEAEAAANARLAAVEGEMETLRSNKVEEAERAARRRVMEVLERARFDAAEQQAEEVMLCKSTRKNVLQAHGFIALAWGNAKALAHRISEYVQQGKLSPKEAVMLARELLRGTREVNQASRLAIQVERLRVGDPTEIVGVQVEPSSLEDAARDIKHAANLLELVERRTKSNGAEEPPPEDDGKPPVH